MTGFYHHVQNEAQNASGKCFLILLNLSFLTKNFSVLQEYFSFRKNILILLITILLVKLINFPNGIHSYFSNLKCVGAVLWLVLLILLQYSYISYHSTHIYWFFVYFVFNFYDVLFQVFIDKWVDFIDRKKVGNMFLIVMTKQFL